jgi:phosphohistidine phosphatase
VTVAFNNIILWRHAEAEPADYELGEDDMARVLTSKGERQAKRMARWLKLYLPKETTLMCSPAVRCEQTAEALNYTTNVSSALRPTTSLQEVLVMLANIETSGKDISNRNVLLIGHQPWLGQLVTHLTGFSGAELTIKKGAIWWLRQSSVLPTDNSPRYSVISVQAPSLLPK